MVKAIGLVNLHSDVDFVGLTEKRPVASVSFLGRYALIDFVLSNRGFDSKKTAFII